MRSLIAAIVFLLNISVAMATVSIAPNNAGIYYSPTLWTTTASNAITTGAGAYFKTTLVATTTCVLNFDISKMGTPPSQIYWRIDRFGPWTKVALSSGTVTLSFPSDTAPWPQHFLEVYVKSTSITNGNRWDPTANPTVAVNLTSITLDNGGSVALPLVAPRKILVFGDSITEGVRTENITAALDTDQNDSTIAYALQLGPLLGAEVGVIGWGAAGWQGSGVGSVPPFPSTYNFIYSGVSRSFAGIDLVVINEGQNDGGNNTTAQVTTVLNGLASAGYNGTIILLQPFNSAQGPFMIAGRAAATNPTQTVYVATTGFFNTANSSDNVHPYGSASINSIAPSIAAVLAQYLYTPLAGWRRF